MVKKQSKNLLLEKRSKWLFLLIVFTLISSLLIATGSARQQRQKIEPSVLGEAQEVTTSIQTFPQLLSTSTPWPTLTNFPSPTSSPIPFTTPTAAAQLLEVIKVVDGDTLAVNINGISETIRLIGIDTPETVDPRKPVQCFGQEASDKAHSLLDGQKVRLEADPSQGERDKYNRLLRYVFLENGTHFNKLMIEEGYAFEYTYNIPYKYQAEFQQAENESREGKRGLWADETCAGKVVLPTNTPQPQTPIPTSASVPPPTSAPQPISPISSTCDCSGNLYNCDDFKTHAEAQACFEDCGGINNDIHRLDNDKDGVACESLP